MIITHRFRAIIVLLIFICGFLVWQIIKYYNEETSKADEELEWMKILERRIEKSSNKSKVLITVYYEALCPDSKSFFIRHLLPVVERAEEYLQVDLIPYGKAETIFVNAKQYIFNCQHGNEECVANKIHACSIRYIRDTLLQVSFTSCMIYDNLNPENIASECARKFRINVEEILRCAQGNEGDELLKAHGEATALLNPAMKFVPTVLINKNHHNQAHILKDLWAEICRFYPEQMNGKCSN